MVTSRKSLFPGRGRLVNARSRPLDGVVIASNDVYRVSIQFEDRQLPERPANVHGSLSAHADDEKAVLAPRVVARTPDHQFDGTAVSDDGRLEPVVRLAVLVVRDLKAVRVPRSDHMAGFGNRSVVLRIRPGENAPRFASNDDGVGVGIPDRWGLHERESCGKPTIEMFTQQEQNLVGHLLNG